MVVRGGSVSGGSKRALLAVQGAKAVAEGTVLEARPAGGGDSSAVQAQDPASMVALRRCVLRVPPVDPRPVGATGSTCEHRSLLVLKNARATVADCTCSGRAMVHDQGSVLLHSGLAFPPGLVNPVGLWHGGVARELPAVAGGAGGEGGPRAAAPAPSVASPGAGSHGAASAPVAAAEAAELVQPSAGTGGGGPVGEAAAVVDGLGSLALGRA